MVIIVNYETFMGQFTGITVKNMTWSVQLTLSTEQDTVSAVHNKGTVHGSAFSTVEYISVKCI